MQGILRALGTIVGAEGCGFCLVVFEATALSRKGTEVDVVCGGALEQATQQEMEGVATALHALADSLVVDGQASDGPGSGQIRAPKLSS
jgi:hypothetical protein